MTSFQELVDLAFGGPEDGQVNFNALHSLLYSLVYKLKLSEDKALLDNDVMEKVKESTKNYALLKSLKESIGVNSFVGLAERLKTLENFWAELNTLPSNEAIIQTVEANVPNQTPLTKMWDIIKTNRTVEASEQAISKLFCLMEDLMKFASELDNYNKELSDALLGPPPGTNMTIKEAIEKLGEIANEFERMNEMMKSITERMGPGTMPTDEFFDNLPSWTLLEQLMNGSYENTLSGSEKRELGEIPLSEEMKKMMTDLGGMVSYNDELMARIQTIENNLQYLTDRSATKADIQKLNVKMAEVQGIAGAVDRLLCRIQGSEDQLCCLRQVINKIYGCIGNTAGVGNTPGVVACLGGKREGTQSSNSQGGGGGGGGSGSGVNETQLKIFMDQLTKVECEMDAIKRNLVSIDGIKADVQNLFSIVNELDENKLDKCLLASEMAQKADKTQVEDKVSQSCFENTCQGFSAVIQDILAKILENDAECRTIFSQLEKLIQLKSDKDELEALKEQLESKLKCMARNFVGLQKFVSEDGDTNERKNANQNQNEGSSKSNTPQQVQSPQQQPQQLPKLTPPSLPLNSGLPGNKIIRQFPLVIKGVEFKGASHVQPCGVKPIKEDSKPQSKKNSIADFKPTTDVCRDLQEWQSGPQRKVMDIVPQLSEMKEFVSTCHENLSLTMNTLRACSSSTKVVQPCNILASSDLGQGNDTVKSEVTQMLTAAKPTDKTSYSGLVIGSDPKNKLTMDFGE